LEKREANHYSWSHYSTSTKQWRG